DKKTETTFTVTGELKDGNTFQGSTKVKIKGKEKGKKRD
ncbi:MAG: hypothetical protein HW406_2851, partial [Candidatus Brocadiaceae bacterium]|nr:hypothetical protein [Candidatus Brocadiaceae bacterium]